MTDLPASLQGFAPAQISAEEWARLHQEIPGETIRETRYFRRLPDASWSDYLFPPSTHLIYGSRLLNKLKFDNSLAALRLWGFVLSEGERLYRARQAGMKVIALMGDLGAVTPLVYSFPNVVAFYPDCLWWTPFISESGVLFREAARFSLGEDCCFVRAALGGFAKRAYFPTPELLIGTVGASCDDMAAVMAHVERLGYRIHYLELPHRNGVNSSSAEELLTAGYRSLIAELERLTGAQYSEDRLGESIRRTNRQRNIIADMRRLAATETLSPMGALEMLNAEFAPLSSYGDPEECLAVLSGLYEVMKGRVEAQVGYHGADLRLVWVTPPADPQLMTYVEGLGGRVVATEYLINQTRAIISESGDPLKALARAQMHGSLMGSSTARAELVLREARAANAEGAIISGIFGSSHCPWETAPIREALRREGVPSLAFDVVEPGRKALQSQLYNRIEAFIEMLTARRRRVG